MSRLRLASATAAGPGCATPSIRFSVCEEIAAPGRGDSPTNAAAPPPARRKTAIERGLLRRVVAEEGVRRIGEAENPSDRYPKP